MPPRLDLHFALDDRDVRRVTDTLWPGVTFEPAWSPDGAQIAFASTLDRPNVAQLYLVDAGGGQLRGLTDSPVSSGHPAWYDPNATLTLSNARRLLSTWGWLRRPR